MSDEMIKAAHEYANNRRHGSKPLGRDAHREARNAFEAGAQWQAAQRQGANEWKQAIDSELVVSLQCTADSYVSGDRARRELEELRAHVERLRQSLSAVISVADRKTVEFGEAKQALNDAPFESLAKIRAEAAEACLTRIDQFATEKQDCMDEIQCFADEIRSGER